MFDALAFVLWDVGTRPPQRLVRDVAGSLRRPRMLGLGLLRFAAGAALLLAAVVVAEPAIPSARAFSVLETLMLIAALIVEQLIGEDVRRLVRRGQTSR